ncbi:MAG TPA: DUF4157 domain-containing protein [Ktedonobacteraceae bacterium]|nr:DUF4157 domain-containing protein [Ktedonobacteraceae bacterium]
MRRGALINRSHRQQALVKSILRPRPLARRLTRHQQLPQALGLPVISILPVSQALPVSPALADTLPASLIERDFRPALSMQQEDAVDTRIEALPATMQTYQESIPAQPAPALAAQLETLVRQGQVAAIQPEHSVSETEIVVVSEAGDVQVESAGVSAAHQTRHETGLETEILARREDIREPELESGQESHSERQEDVRSPISQSAAELEAVQPLAEDMHASTDTVVRQAARLAAYEAVQARPVEDAKSPIETVRPRRPRRNSEELPAQTGQRAPSTLATKKETREPQRHAQAARAQWQSEAQTASGDGINADDLFVPTNTDRSPQVWLARLMGKRVPAQEEAGTGMETAPEQDVAVTNRGSEAPLYRESANVQPREKLSNVQPQQESVRETLYVRPEENGGRAQGIAPTASPSETDVQGQGKQQIERPSALRTVPGVANMPTTAQGARTVQAIAGAPEMPQAARTVQPRQSEQLSSQTRRFLRPLMGIDPASVQIHRDAQSTRLADAYHADAVTMGDTIELPRGNASDTPETLGLLAHELTHVARQRNPGFVPPILRTTDQASARTQTPAQDLAWADEETLALQVERQVWQVTGPGASYRVGPPLAGSLGEVGGPVMAGGLGGQIISPAQHAVSPLPSAPLAPSELTETRRAANDPWNGLPAPWEPLPGWLTTPQIATGQGVSSSPAPVQMPAPTISPASEMTSNGGNQQASGYADIAVQRAERGRTIGEEAIPAAPVSQEMRAPEPDLDELARQVYSILRNRLEVERRRHR